MRRSDPSSSRDILLEAEVAPRAQEKFEARYFEATGQRVSPGSTRHYQNQPNKWGMELRVYFNDDVMKDRMARQGANVELNQTGYLSEKYRYRVNDNELWWQLVERDGLRLGQN